jgi:DNA-binding transcriptional regulator YiaG
VTEKQHIKTPVQIAPFVEVLGVDGTVDFLLAFGGAELAFSKSPRETSKLSQHVGHDKATALGVVAARLPRRIPLEKRWIAKVLDSQDLSQADIARRMHVQDKTVRRYLKGEYAPSVEDREQKKTDDRQPRLL